MFEFRALSSCRAKFKLLQLIIRSTLFFIFCCSDNSNNQLATMQSQKKYIKPISLPWEFSAISARKRLWFREHLNMRTAITTTNILFTMPQARRPGGWNFFFLICIIAVASLNIQKDSARGCCAFIYVCKTSTCNLIIDNPIRNKSLKNRILNSFEYNIYLIVRPAGSKFTYLACQTNSSVYVLVAPRTVRLLTSLCPVLLFSIVMSMSESPVVAAPIFHCPKKKKRKALSHHQDESKIICFNVNLQNLAADLIYRKQSPQLKFLKICMSISAKYINGF